MSPTDVKPAAGMRVKVRVDQTKPWRLATVVRVDAESRYIYLICDDTPRAIGGWHEDRWGETLIPADPAPEASTACFVVGERVVLRGTVKEPIDRDGDVLVTLDHNIGMPSVYAKPAALRPESAPAAAVGDWISNPKAFDQAFKASGWVSPQEHAAVKGALEKLMSLGGTTDVVGLRMQLGDLRAALMKSEERASKAAWLERDNARLRRELAEAKNMRRWREGF